ncbi:MAG: transcription antitermination factor NusB [Gemmatimonadota bacterium]
MGGAVQSAGGHAELTARSAHAPRRAARPGRGAGQPDSARTAAFQILQDVEGGAYADRAAERRLAGVPPAERRLAMELAYGCIRLRSRLDTELTELADRPLSRLDGPVLLWLRLGLYQLHETRVPGHAAVHESVEGVRRSVGARAAGFANAVLRAGARLDPAERLALFPSLETDLVGHLSTFGSHPEWLVRRWLERYSRESVIRLVELDNRPPPVMLRTLDPVADERANREPRLTALDRFPGSWELGSGDPSGLLARLPAIVQDPAASAVVEYVGSLSAGPAIDVCAAPGGKAIALASRGEAVPYVAADRSRPRLERAVRAASALGVDLIPLVADGRSPPLRPASTVLLDVPCLGTGVLRRRADARWRAGPARLAALVRLQRQLLDAAVDLVEPGGLLVYATCSLESEENDEQVSGFLTRHPEFVREPAPEGLAIPPELIGPNEELRVLPWQRGTDGSFAVRLRRSA